MFATGCKSVCTIIMDSLADPSSCSSGNATHVFLYNIPHTDKYCKWVIFWVELSLHGLGMIELHSSARIHLFRSNWIRASLARLTDRQSSVKFIPDPPLEQACRNAAHRAMIMSAVEFYHVSPSPHSLSLGPDVQRVQMVWFQQARSCCTRVHSDRIDVDSVWVRVDVVAELYVKSLCLIAFDESE